MIESLTLQEVKERLRQNEHDELVLDAILYKRIYLENKEGQPMGYNALTERRHPQIKELLQKIAKEKVTLKRAIRLWEEKMQNTRIEVDLDGPAEPKTFPAEDERDLQRGYRRGYDPARS